MLAGFIDHLWQSIAFTAITGGLVCITRRNSAALQLWLWRIAAVKFLLPFSVLFVLGAWLGFPVRHSAVPPPAALVEWVSTGMSIAAPAATFELTTIGTVVALVSTLVVSAVCGLVIVRGLRRTRRLHQDEQARISADWDYRPLPLGFAQSALLAAAALFCVSLPVIAGATRD